MTDTTKPLAGMTRQRVALYAYLLASTNWETNSEIAKGCGISYGCAHKHTAALAKMGVLEMTLLYQGGSRFRMAKKPNPAYVEQLERLADIFGVKRPRLKRPLHTVT